MRCLSLAALSVLAGAACSTPDREFPSAEDSPTSSTATSSSGTPTSSSGGDGGDGDGGSGGDASTPSSSGSRGGGDPGDCGNGEVDAGETCDEDTSLCNACHVECPPGWFPIGTSCFAVALGDIEEYDALTADAKCGALDVAASGHRAHAATPESLLEFDSLATRCVNEGCWLGFYALGPPGEGAFSAPSTDEALLEAPPWNDGEPSVADDEVCLKLALSDDGVTVLEDQPCDNLGYFACELEVDFGSFATCHDGVVDAGEECDDEDDDQCVDCDRQCLAGWVEDPRTHQCYSAVDGLEAWGDADGLCLDAGGRLATPDEIADVRIAAVVTDDAWLGLETSGLTEPIVSWRSGEDFTYEAPAYPLPTAAENVGDYGALVDGLIVFGTPEGPHGALCEAFDPDG